MTASITEKPGRTPLMLASFEGHADVVKLLLAAGADVRLELDEDGESHNALDIAKKAGHADVVKILKEHGAKEAAPPRAKRRFTDPVTFPEFSPLPPLAAPAGPVSPSGGGAK